MSEIAKSGVFFENSIWKWYVYTLELVQQTKNDRNWCFLKQNMDFRGNYKDMWTISHENMPR